MPETRDLLPRYVEHLRARVRSEQGRHSPALAGPLTLPRDIEELTRRDPHACLQLVVDALGEATEPEVVRAIGNELLENLLNDSSSAVAGEVSQALRTNKRFRQAFGFGKYASVDPAVVEEWVSVLQDLGTTKEAERKSTWKRAP